MAAGENQEFQPSNLSDELLGAIVMVPFATPVAGATATVFLTCPWEIEIVDVNTKIDVGTASFTVTKGGSDVVDFAQDNSAEGAVNSDGSMDTDTTLVKYVTTGGILSDTTDDEFVDIGDTLEVNVIDASSDADNLQVQLHLRYKRDPT